MIQMYYNLVVAGRRTCNPKNKNVTMVPQSLIADVIKMLEQAGRDLDGKLV